jgi:curved DNA-binding protein CbpA
MRNDGADERANGLSEEVKARIDALDARLDSLDYYKLLGVGRLATRNEIRSAFLATAPAFHPDRYFGKAISPTHLQRMERIFGRMGIARDVLLDEAQRAAYDATLAPEAPASTPQGPPPSTPPRHKASSGVDLRPPSDPPPRSSNSGIRPSPVTDAERARAFAARLSGGMRTPTPGRVFSPTGAKPPAEAPRRDSTPSHPAIDPKAAAEELKRRYQARISTGSMRTADVRAALETKQNDHAAAVERAKEAETRQDFAQAGVEWSRAFDAIASAEVANRAALCFRRAGADLRRAAKLAEEAVRLDPGKATYHLTLALVCADAGLVVRAKAEIERAHQLEPANPRIVEALARIKKM